jgi:hypothetical protein
MNNRKLVVKWCKNQQRYEARHPQTNVTGEGATPGDAIRNWQYWWDCPL